MRIFTLLAFVMLCAPITYVSAAVAPVVSIEPTPAEVKSAMAGFKSLSNAERKAKVKDAKKAVKEFKAAKKAGKAPSTNTLLLVILALLLPPLAVYLHQGEINGKFWLNLVLTLLFFIPGVIHALIVVLGKD